MSKLEPHPLSKLFPPIPPEDFDQLAADIKLNGLHQRIVIYQDQILDGNNRYRACEDAGIKATFVEFKGSDAQARNACSSVSARGGTNRPLALEQIVARQGEGTQELV
jgi:ParB-like chromosome segregation protein Spo0J